MVVLLADAKGRRPIPIGQGLQVGDRDDPHPGTTQQGPQRVVDGTPVEVGDPRIEYYAAAVRKDLKGGSGPDWHPEEALNRVQALALFTVNPAQADHRPDGWGRLVKGSPANITVFSRELLTAADADLPTTRPVLTVVRGRTVHDAR